MRRTWAWIAVVAVVWPTTASAFDPLQRAARAAARSQRALAAGDTALAVQEMLRAQSLAPDDPRLRMGLGETFFSSQEFRSARTQFERVAREDGAGEFGPDALFNAGNAAFAEGDLQTALDRYTVALLAGDRSPDLMHNLELAQRLLEQQQSEPQSSPSPGESDASEQQDSSSGEQPPAEDAPPQEDPSSGPSQPDSSRAQPPPPSTEESAADSTEARLEPLPDQMSAEQAMRLLDALDFDEEELRKAIQRRLRGEQTESSRAW